MRCASSIWVAKLEYADEDDFIRHGLELEPETVHEALVMLRRMKPDWAVPYQAAADIGRTLRAGKGRPKESERDKSSNTRNTAIGKKCDATYYRARLERDGHTEELAAIERGETTANAVAVKLGWRSSRISIQPTVEGFARAILAHLTAEQRAELRAKEW
jgi:hypothetical protein